MDKKWQDYLDKREGKDIYKYWKLDKEEYVEKIENGYLHRYGKNIKIIILHTFTMTIMYLVQ